MEQTTKLKVTPKDFFLWLGAMVALYSSVVAFLTLTFQYINSAFPDPLAYSYDPYSGSIKFAIATLVVAFPLFLVLMRIIRRDISANPEKTDLWVRRWALYLTVFIAGFTVASDLVTLIYYFLDGEVTMRFGLKVLMVLLVAGAGLMHFLADIWGYWTKHPAYAQYVGLAVAALILVTVGSGFLIIGSPMDARLYKYDDQKTNDLTNIQYQLVEYYRQKGEVPATLTELYDPISGNFLPLDPQTGLEYTYTKKGALEFSLCATFNKESRPTDPNLTRPVAVAPIKGMPGETGIDIYSLPWTHATGEVCFDRAIDADRYPVYTK